MAMNVKFRVVSVFTLSLSLATIAVAASKTPAKRLAQDPNAPVVEFFDAVDHGQVEATVIAKNANSATVFVTNTTKAAVNVQFPRVVAAVPVLKQLGFGQRGN